MTQTVVLASLTRALMITAFVTVMMITVEYLSVLTQGTFQTALSRNRWTQYAAAALLGALPGCLGAFTIVALYTHRAVSFGAVVATMIATSGDEAFVLFALIPAKALSLTLGLALIGLLAGPVVDFFARYRRATEPCFELLVHDTDDCRCFPGIEVLKQWRHPGWARIVLTASMLAFFAFVSAGLLGPSVRTWIRLTLLAVSLFGAFVVSTVPDHFLHDHLWGHVVGKHVPRVFAWTFGVLLTFNALGRFIDVGTYVQSNTWGVLAASGLVGVIPESGPHLVFVTMYADRLIPISILVASSIVQDGHGMLPLLAESRKDFVLIKGINLVIGLGVGATMLALGF
jgi:hypothetical protein